ncbi:MAG: DNA primase [Chloroflexota bacterium]|nr:DNA primase [Chloroflexota bacterium]MDE2685193.1 DNA primase [Chloroflexota bacterium]
MTQIDDVKSRLDIVELISGYVNLQRSGSSLKANCPFHQERTPSFFVFPDRQSWRCFGSCAEGGDAFSFVMKADRVEFRDALQTLAARVGVTLVNNQESGGVARQLFEINDAARLFFQRMLGEPEAAFVRDYLAQRGISDRSIQTFELGYSPPRDNRLLAHLRQAGYEDDLIVRAALAGQTDDGRRYDFFRGRLMIPIRDWQARVAGFGSRALDPDATPKYLNTPRTPVFDKSRILYAMHLAKEPVRQRGAVIVEGYMDAVMAHQHGYDNVVASMGTALTEHQVALVRRLTNNVTMALDGDPAGRNATLRSLESSWGVFQRRNSQQTSASMLQQPDAMELRVAELPPGQDPDDYIRREPGAWPAFVEQAQELFDYLLTSLSGRADLESPDGRSWVAHTMLRFVAQIPDPVRSDLYLDRLSARLGLNNDTLRTALRETQRQSANHRRGLPVADTAAEATPPPARDYDAVEESLLAFLLQHGMETLGNEYQTTPSTEWFSRSENREIYRNVIAGMGSDEVQVGPELESHLDALRSRELRLSSQVKREKAWLQMSLALEREYLNNETKQLSSLPEIMDNMESPLAQRLLDNNSRIGEIDRLLKPSAPTGT